MESHRSSSALPLPLPLPPRPAVNPAFAGNPPPASLKASHRPGCPLMKRVSLRVHLTSFFMSPPPPPRPPCLDYVYVFLTAVLIIINTIPRVGRHRESCICIAEEPDRYKPREPESGAALPLFLSMLFLFQFDGQNRFICNNCGVDVVL